MSAIDLWTPVAFDVIVNNRTGEAINLTEAEWHTLALLRKAIVDTRPALNETARLVDTEIARRLDADNDRHIFIEGVDGESGIELRVNRPHETVWDIDKLRGNLQQLVNEGRLAAGVPPRAVKAEVSYTAVASELNKLVDHDDPRVVELVTEARSTVPATRRVSVKIGR